MANPFNIRVRVAMKKVARMRRSGDRWKDKATKRAEQIREFRKTKARQQSRIEGLQARIEALEQPVSREKKRLTNR